MLEPNEVSVALDDETYAQFQAHCRAIGLTVNEALRVLIRRDAGLADENRAAQLEGQKKAKKLA